MSGSEQLSMALLIEFLEGRVTTLSVNDYLLSWKAHLAGRPCFRGGYIPEDDKVVLHPDLDPKQAIRILYHEVGHRLYGSSELEADLYAHRRCLEWDFQSDEDRQGRLKKGIVKWMAENGNRIPTTP